MKALLQKISRILKDRRARQMLTRIVSVTAAIVVFVTTYALVLPAITMETEAQCGIEAHQHSDECYTDVLTCTISESEEHTHDASCFKKVLTCEKEVHVHSPACYHADTASKAATDKTEAAASNESAIFAGPESMSESVSNVPSAGSATEDALSENEDSNIGTAGPGTMAGAEDPDTDSVITDSSSGDFGEGLDSRNPAGAISSTAAVTETAGVAAASGDTAEDPASTASASSTDAAAAAAGDAASTSSTDVAAAAAGDAASTSSTDVAAAAAGDATSTASTAENALEDSANLSSDSSVLSDPNGADQSVDANGVKSDAADGGSGRTGKDADAYYPAVSFEDSITVTSGALSTDMGIVSGEAGSMQVDTEIIVHVEAGEGAFPEGTTMVLSSVSDDQMAVVAETVEGVVSDSVGRSATQGFHAVDISFRDRNGVEIEPLNPIKVSLTSDAIKRSVEEESSTPVVVHISDAGNPVETGGNESGETGNAAEVKDNDLTDGAAVEKDDDLGDPEGIQDDAAQNFSEHLNTDLDTNLNTPTATVIESETVTETVKNSDDTRETGTLTFEAGSFSVYAIVYTVDFHWEVNGKTYDFSIPGGGFVSLEHLVEVLNIVESVNIVESDTESGKGTEEREAEATYDEAVRLNEAEVSEAARKLVEDVESVEFSGPELVWTGKVDSASTVGSLKKEHGLSIQYSAELPEELISEIDSSELEAGDWVLISLLPFDSVETLSVTMKNGDKWAITVTDANANARKASMIPASGIYNNQNLVIYQKVIQPDDSILYYAVDGNGNLQRVYNSSDSVYWLNDPPIIWKVTALSDGAGTGTGYYTLYNEATGNYLVPKDDDGTYKVVHKLSDFSDGDAKHLNVSLPGKESGQYLSKIASWDYDANVTYGMEVASSTDIHAKELLSSQDFFFATPDEIVQGRLTTVETVDSLSKGIKITMFDFTGNEWQIDPTPRLSYMTRVIGDSSYVEGVYHPGLVRPVLGTDGFPVSTQTGQSIRPVFQSQGNYYSNSSNSWSTPGTFSYTVSQTDNVNHLFLQSVYDATGYFYYSCFENYARLNGSSFDVYEQLGTPWDGEEFFFHRGNFTPYNSLDLSHILSNHTSSSSSSALGDDDPRKGEDLYVVNGDADYYFGMIMESDFLQGPDGYNDRDEPTVYEFNGDDDLWIYIDNVLVLDIGGVHDAFQGRIDFATGAVTITNSTSTTIKEMFRNAGRFPDGTSWNESLVNDYFKGDTFRDYSTHTFKMFYMERGAAASNLEMKFNLMPVQGSSFRVTKQIPETSSGDVIQNDYADAVFYYRAYIGTDVCTQSAFGSSAKYTDGTPVVWKDNTTFQLKHGQTAIFPAASNTVRYHVEEVEPETGSAMLDHYYITNSDPAAGQADGGETVSAEKSIQQRGEVVFTNKPDDSIVNELRIVKDLKGEMYTDDRGNLLVNEETGSPYFE